MYRFLFSSRWLKYIAGTIVLVIACVGLAIWQKDRLQQREDEIATINANYSAAPVSLTDVLDSPTAVLGETEEWKQVELTGTFDTAHTVLARNRTVNDHTGFYVVVPFTLDTGESIAVVRGWVSDEKAVPTAPDGTQTLIARLRPAQDGSDDKNPPGLIKAIDPAKIPGLGAGDYAHVYAEAADISAGADPSAPLTGLPKPDTDPGNHLSYMLQWFAFGIMIIIAVTITARKERKAGAEAAAAQSGEVEYVVVDKAALEAGAKIEQPGNRYGRYRATGNRVHGAAEAEEDALLEQRFRSH